MRKLVPVLLLVFAAWCVAAPVGGAPITITGELKNLDGTPIANPAGFAPVVLNRAGVAIEGVNAPDPVVERDDATKKVVRTRYTVTFDGDQLPQDDKFFRLRLEIADSVQVSLDGLDGSTTDSAGRPAYTINVILPAKQASHLPVPPCPPPCYVYPCEPVYYPTYRWHIRCR